MYEILFKKINYWNRKNVYYMHPCILLAHLMFVLEDLKNQGRKHQTGFHSK